MSRTVRLGLVLVTIEVALLVLLHEGLIRLLAGRAVVATLLASGGSAPIWMIAAALAFVVVRLLAVVAGPGIVLAHLARVAVAAGLERRAGPGSAAAERGRRPRRSRSAMSRGLGGSLLLVLLLPALPAEAAFEDGEVSRRASPPFLLSKTQTTHQDFSAWGPDLTYNVYRRVPGDVFRCFSQNRTQPTGPALDPDTPPPGEVWWYVVNADVGSGENRHGSEVPIAARCPCSGPAPVAGQPPLTMRRLVIGLTQPVHLTHPPGDRRLFIVERIGRIRLLEHGLLDPVAFLDISAQVVTNVEQGMASMAFHPAYASNGRFFVIYTRRSDEATVLSEFRVGSDPRRADPATERVLLTLPQIARTHKGGQLAFGSRDGYLYVSLGDGGSVCDVQGQAQNLATLYGKILRLDVDGAEPYAIPPDNPFATDGDPSTRDEIWAYGLRNPWRFSFDPLQGDLYIGDVGETSREEVSVQPGASPGGEDYGWSCMEGTRCNPCNRPQCLCPPPPGPVPPVMEYEHTEGCAVIGGHVYRGCRLPGYHGTYFYADACANFARSFVLAGGVATDPRDWSQEFQSGVTGPSSWGVDVNGEIYVVDIWTGMVYRVEPAP